MTENNTFKEKYQDTWCWLITSGARSAERVLCSLREKTWVCAARPDPITLLRSLYLRNGLTDSRAVFFVRCHHSINFVLDLHRYPPVPATTRGTCRARGCQRHPTIDNFTTADPIAFKFGVCLETSYFYFYFFLLLLHKAEVGCICTCARARPFSMSRKRLGGLR